MPTPYRSATGLADQVARDLRERILTGELGSGQPLRESALAAEHSASRNTVRESFRLLARDRLVTHEAHKGVTVRRLTAADVRDIYRVRLALEPGGLRLVDPDALAEVVDAARRAAEVGDWGAVSTGDLRFHQLLVAALGSPRFDEMFLSVLAELRLAFARMADGRGFHAPYLDRNARLVDLVGRGDLDAATAELTDYLETAREQLCDVVTTPDR